MKAKTMKKNWIVRIALLTLVLTLITWSLASGTFAKYTETTTGIDSSRVANFAYTVADGDSAEFSSTSAATISVFDCVDAGVKTVAGEKLIAPGTTGSFEINVTNSSEVLVGAEFAITLGGTGKDSIPVYYTYDGLNYASFYTASNATTAIAGVTLTGDIAAMAAAISADAAEIAIEDSVTAEITWTWAFESAAGIFQNDAADTTLGKTSPSPTLSLTVAATITQLDD